MNQLHLYQELTLLAIKDEKGTFLGMAELPIAGAILSELLLDQRLVVTDDKKQTVSISSDVPATKPTGNELFDEALQLIADDSKPRSLQHWVSRVSHIKELKHRVARELCDLKILKAEEDKVLWIFTRRTYPEINPKFEREIKDRMAKLMFAQASSHDERTTVLIALAKSIDILKANFDRERLKIHKDRIANIVSGDMYAARATKSAVVAVHTAIMAATIIPVLVSN